MEKKKKKERKNESVLKKITYVFMLLKAFFKFGYII